MNTLEDEFYANLGCPVAEEKRNAALKAGQEMDARIAAVFANYPSQEEIDAYEEKVYRERESRWDSKRSK